MATKPTETAMLKASLYAAILRKGKDHITDGELELINLLAQDHEIKDLLEQDVAGQLERAIKKGERP